jgi:hypothetical protein
LRSRHWQLEWFWMYLEWCSQGNELLCVFWKLEMVVSKWGSNGSSFQLSLLIAHVNYSTLHSATSHMSTAMAKKWWSLHKQKTDWQINLICEGMMSWWPTGMGRAKDVQAITDHNTASATGAKNSTWWICVLIMPTRNCEVVAVMKMDIG